MNSHALSLFLKTVRLFALKTLPPPSGLLRRLVPSFPSLFFGCAKPNAAKKPKILETGGRLSEPEKMIAGVLRGRSHMWQMHSAAAGSIGAPILRRSLPKPHQQGQCYNRFPHSIYRKTRDLEELRPSSNVLSSKIGLVSWYLGMVKSRPILTKSVTCAFIYAAADLSSQNFQTIVQPSSVSYDFVRMLRMAGYGMLILGPSLHFWFNFVSKVLPKRDLFTTLTKIVMGQTLYGPVMTVVFFSTNAALQGENSTEIVARLKRDLLPTMINGVMYWPICDFITFKFIPVHLQPLVSNSFSYLWTVYLTYMAGLEKAASSS